MKRLLSSLKGAKPESRFFISLWFRFFAPEAGVPLPVAEIAKMLGVSKNVVMSSLAYMTTEGFFERSHIHLGVRVGRPTSQYFATHKLLAILSDYEHPRFHAGLIEELHSNNHQHLTLSNRLLLCVFLLHANEFGLVENLGFSVIAQMTGMSNDQFNSQLDKLSRLRYFRKLSSGVTSKVIFGSKPSIYLLDITNERFSSAIFRSVTCEQAISTEEYQDTLKELISISKNGLVSFSHSQQKDDDSKSIWTNAYAQCRKRFAMAIGIEGAESSWIFFIELASKPALKKFLFEKILLTVAQSAISRRELNQEWLTQLSISFCQELQPVFLKKGKVFIGKNHAEEIDKNGKKSHVDERESGDEVDLFDTTDLSVFAEVLVRCVIFPAVKTLKYKTAILKKHFKAPFQFAFLLDEKTEGVIEIKRPLDIYYLYPISNGPYEKRVYIEAGEVHPIGTNVETD